MAISSNTSIDLIGSGSTKLKASPLSPLTARIFVSTATAALIFIAASCGSSATVDADSTASSSEETTTVPNAETASNADPTSTTTKSESSDEDSADEFPSITNVEAVTEASGLWTISVTVSSPYDSPERYADAWRVLDESGNELAIRELTHDHAGEQPFTRDLEGVEIPNSVKVITVEGRDLANGWGGQTFTYSLPSAGSY